MSAPTLLRSSYDAVVVGARCAGASTAMLLARAGLRVLAVDRGRYGSDTLSTHALMRAGVLQLHRWGVLPGVAAAGTPVVTSTSFHYGDEVVEIPIEPQPGMAGLFAPRRTVLDALLVDAAREADAEVAYGLRVLDLVRGPAGRVRGVIVGDRDGGRLRIDAGLVIGADGVQSTVARLAGAPIDHLVGHASGVVYGYWEGLADTGYRWYYGPGVSVGAIPTNDGATCVFVSMPSSRFFDEIRFDLAAGYRRLLAGCAPALAAEAAPLRRIGSFRGFPGTPGFLRRCHGPGWALVGDAGYFKDPLTAHGISDALRDAELLARAVIDGGDAALAGYQEVRDDLGYELFRVTDQIASFDWDLATLRELHLSLSREMKREVRALEALGRSGSGRSAAGQRQYA